MLAHHRKRDDRQLLGFDAGDNAGYGFLMCLENFGEDRAGKVEFSQANAVADACIAVNMARKRGEAILGYLE